MKTLKGTVTSAKMIGTVTVTVNRSVFHPLYKKRFPVSKKFLADSKGVDVGVGDEVVITECRPLSKRKHFRISEITKRAPRVSELQEEAAVRAQTEAKQKEQEAESPSES